MLSRFRRIFVFRVSFSKFGSRVIHVQLFLRFAIPSKHEIIEGHEALSYLNRPTISPTFSCFFVSVFVRIDVILLVKKIFEKLITK